MPESVPPCAHPLSRRCPRLGNPVPFSYCLDLEAPGPCFKVIDCWWETFDVLRFLQDHLTPPAFEQLLTARPMPKAASLAELAARLKQTRP